MITATAFGTPRQIHHEASGHYLITDYIRGPEPDAPQAFLVHDVRHPGVIAPHFHKVQQF